ncbi:hypothetical protein PENSPDRAFT_747006 [Peniophora sp. CONT]|nr:hypothetical protein PENSPDRAFT_747006 [Peniophora sp. CONT]
MSPWSSLSPSPHTLSQALPLELCRASRMSSIISHSAPFNSEMHSTVHAASPSRTNPTSTDNTARASVAGVSISLILVKRTEMISTGAHVNSLLVDRDVFASAAAAAASADGDTSASAAASASAEIVEGSRTMVVSTTTSNTTTATTPNSPTATNPNTTTATTANTTTATTPSSTTATAISPSSSGTSSGNTHTSSPAIIGGAAGGAVGLLLLAGMLFLCLRRRRRQNRLVVNDASIINEVAQFAISSPVIRSRKGEAMVREEYTITETAQEVLHTSDIPGSQNPSVTGGVPDSHEDAVLDFAAASAMFRQLERFMRSVQGCNRQRVPPSVDDADLDSLPQYRSEPDI